MYIGPLFAQSWQLGGENGSPTSDSILVRCRRRMTGKFCGGHLVASDRRIDRVPLFCSRKPAALRKAACQSLDQYHCPWQRLAGCEPFEGSVGVGDDIDPGLLLVVVPAEGTPRLRSRSSGLTGKTEHRVTSPKLHFDITVSSRLPAVATLKMLPS